MMSAGHPVIQHPPPPMRSTASEASGSNRLDFVHTLYEFGEVIWTSGSLSLAAL